MIHHAPKPLTQFASNTPKTLAGSGTVPNRDYKTMLALPSKTPRVQGLSPVEATKNASISCDMRPRSNHWADKKHGFESIAPSGKFAGALAPTYFTAQLRHKHAMGRLTFFTPKA